MKQSVNPFDRKKIIKENAERMELQQDLKVA